MAPVRIVSLIFTFLFIIFAVFQFNDPDALVWIAIYGIAALISLAVYFQKINLTFLIAATVVYFMGAIYMWPPTFEGIFLDMGYKIEIEEARESLGLAICGLAMAFYSFAIYKNKRKAIY
jgi:hypothetical protein